MTTDVATAELMAERAWQKPLGYARDGLPPVYSSIYDYLYDFYPDFPWDGEGTRVSCDYLLLKPQMDFDLLQRIFQFDMRADLRKARNYE